MRRIALLSAACLLPTIAAASPLHGLYIGAAIGPGFTGRQTSAGGSTQIDTSAGPAATLSAGWGFGNGLRVELEGNYRSNAIDSIDTRRASGQLLPLSNVTGRLASYGVMANLAYDLPFAPFGLHPYIGAGIGYARLDFNDAGGNGIGRFDLSGGSTVTAPDDVSFGSAGAFAYQAILGAAMPLHMLPGLDLTLEYRFFGTTRANVPVSRVALAPVNGLYPTSTTHDGFSLHDQTVLLGLRYRFASP